MRKETGVIRPSPPGATATTINGDGGSSTHQTNGNGKKATTNGATVSSNTHSLPGPGEASNLHAATTASLALPQVAVDEALRVTREVLDKLVEIEEDTGKSAA